MLTLVTTADGSATIFNSAVGEHYHSRHGALQESRHVFLHSGLEYFLERNPVKEVRILEVGLGTGLNFLLTADHCTQHEVRLNYTGIEAYPLSPDLIGATGYQEYVAEDIWNRFLESYGESLAGEEVALNPYCRLQTAHCKLETFETDRRYDLLYFDAFAAIHQPEIWNYQALEHITKFLKPGGVFVTYAITGNLKRSMKALGFAVEKAPGAPGKREMLRAVKMKFGAES